MSIKLLKMFLLVMLFQSLKNGKKAPELAQMKLLKKEVP